jgi:sialate O-acetylesterase
VESVFAYDSRSIHRRSAIFFVRDLFENSRCRSGLINSSFGGTLAEAWTSGEAILGAAEFAPGAQAAIEQMKRAPADQAAFPTLLSAWEQANGVADSTNEGMEKGWASPRLR